MTGDHDHNPHTHHAAQLNLRITRHIHVHRNAWLIAADVKHCGHHSWTLGVVALRNKLEHDDELFEHAHTLWASLDTDMNSLLQLHNTSMETHAVHSGMHHEGILPLCRSIKEKIDLAIQINDEVLTKYPVETEGDIAYNFQLGKNVSQNLSSLVEQIHTY